jgi:hypothetical protein
MFYTAQISLSSIVKFLRYYPITKVFGFLKIIGFILSIHVIFFQVTYCACSNLILMILAH